jgi:hypothetical protein
MLRRSSSSRFTSLYGFIRARQSSPGDLHFEVNSGDITPLDQPLDSPTCSSPMRRSATFDSDDSNTASPTTGHFSEALASRGRSPARQQDRHSLGHVAMFFIPRYNPEGAEEYKRAHQHVFGAQSQQRWSIPPPPERPLPSPPASPLSLRRTPELTQTEDSVTESECLQSPEGSISQVHPWSSSEHVQWKRCLPLRAVSEPLAGIDLAKSKRRKPRPTPLCLVSSSFTSIQSRSSSGSGSNGDVESMFGQSATSRRSGTLFTPVQRSPLSPLSRMPAIARSEPPEQDSIHS